MTPAGRLSPPGIFKGYSYDTLGTRYGAENPTIPLGLLGQYRHVIWMIDQDAVGAENSPTSLTLPMTTLLYMSRPNRQNTLATWVSQGGKLWALGDGLRQRHQLALEQPEQRPQPGADLHVRSTPGPTWCRGGSCSTWRTGVRSSGSSGR